MTAFRSRPSSRQVPKKLDQIHLIMGVFFVVALLVVLRLFRLQIIESSFFRAAAEGQRSLAEELLPVRGEIYAYFGPNSTELQPLVNNERRWLVYAVPKEIKDPSQVVKQLKVFLETDEETLLNRLSKSNDVYEPLQNNVTEEIVSQIESLNIVGLGYAPAPTRVYPLYEVTGNLTGFVGYVGDERAGQYGWEQYFDELLTGQYGFIESEQDPAGRLISFADRTFTPAVDGADIVTTIDPNVQAKACELLSRGVTTYAASGGTIIVMDPTTGALQAICVSPHFDPNEYGQVADIDVYLNQAISGTYEPGSIFKVITMAAALDTDSVRPDTKYVDEGQVVFRDFTIRNADGRVYGEQNMTQVLEKSINTGAVYAALQTGRLNLQRYIKKFGFGSLTGVDLPAEAAGDISALDKTGEIFTATASFGQGITVTPIQMLTAFAAIANRGMLVKPHTVKEIRSADGKITDTIPQEVSQVITPKTAATLSAMLVNAIEIGYGDNARVDGFYVAGKTGTAQIAGPGGYTDDTIHSFVGFGPIGSPKFAVLIKLDKPQAARFAASTAAPVFRDLANFLLQYYQLPPER
jgi:cell division protein FtsI/penicillin-binding protein 2